MKTATITAIDQGKATVEIDGQILSLPVADLPGTPVVGKTIHLLMINGDVSDLSEAELARSILNEILKSETNRSETPRAR